VGRSNSNKAGRGRVQAVATEIMLGAEEPRGFLGRRRRRGGGNLIVTKGGLVLEARQSLRGRLQIAWDSVRKAIVDDGDRWGHVGQICRFPVYDLHADGSGSGTLIGPLWARAASLMPPACPLLEIDPVGDLPPNLALLLEPPLAVPSLRGGGRATAAILLLHAAEPETARRALGEHVTVGELDPEDLAFLEAAGSPGATARRAADSA
jgi:hypothetical protein